ncbi:hypothetical protein ACFWUP_30245 [Nocardia sp. NPDC058658]|uniref:hypothetical protein n=1 Tax=Nocardia sp. NPDC058658 TaxID=3346580 RepID=UPI003663C16C
MTDTMTRPEFDLAVHHGTAGPVTDLAADTVARWRESDPSWKAKHWAYTDPDEHRARRLRPINLSTRTKATD